MSLPAKAALIGGGLALGYVIAVAACIIAAARNGEVLADLGGED